MENKIKKTEFNIFKKSLNLIDYYVYALCEINGEKRTPFYIGRGSGDRCLHHINDKTDTEKSLKIQLLLEQEKFGIDILRHGIKTLQAVKLIESTCIDLIGVGKLSNKVKGSGKDMGRMSLDEIHDLKSGLEVEISNKHKGLAFLLNETYKSGMTELALFEATRGIWKQPPRDIEIKYAYSTYGGIIKEIYEIHCWLKAGTQQYFTRLLEPSRLEGRWEFVGRKANDEIREKYQKKIIKKQRSYGNPFVKVGF